MFETITLKYPVEHDDKTITELEMRRPKVRDHLWLKVKCGSAEKRKTNPDTKQPYDDFDVDLMMFARLTDQPEEVFAKLDMVDWGKCRDTYLSCVQGSKS